MKIGDKVKITGDPYRGANHKLGDIGVIVSKDYNLDGIYTFDFGVEVNGEVGPYDEDELQLIEEKSMNPYKKGQVLVDKDNDKKTVIEILGDLVFLSDWNAPEIGGRTYHYKEIDRDYTLESTSPDIKELTLEEIAEKFDVPVDKIRVKD